jgi:hypothetical protein
VLKRIDLTKSLPKRLQLVKEMQSCHMVVLYNFYLMVSTIKYKQESEIDLKKSMEVTLQTLESQGAQNMIVKQEDFETEEGVSGLKSYGTFSRFNIDSKDSEKLYYEVVLFSQEGGLQQIMIFMKKVIRMRMKYQIGFEPVELIQVSK